MTEEQRYAVWYPISQRVRVPLRHSDSGCQSFHARTWVDALRIARNFGAVLLHLTDERRNA